MYSSSFIREKQTRFLVSLVTETLPWKRYRHSCYVMCSKVSILKRICFTETLILNSSKETSRKVKGMSSSNWIRDGSINLWVRRLPLRKQMSPWPTMFMTQKTGIMIKLMEVKQPQKSRCQWIKELETGGMVSNLHLSIPLQRNSH